MAWFIPLDAVTLWTVGVIVTIFVTVGIVCLFKGFKELKWPETPAQVISYTERSNDEQMQYYPTLRTPHTSRLPRKVVVTRGMRKAPEIGSQCVLKYHPQGKKIWVKGETPGTMMKIAGTCFVLAVLIPFAVLGFIDWEAS